MASTGSSGVPRWLMYPLRSTAPAAAWVMDGAWMNPPLSAGGCRTGAAPQPVRPELAAALVEPGHRRRVHSGDGGRARAAGRTFSSQP